MILWRHAIHQGWPSVFDVIIKYYTWVKNFVLSPIQPILEFILNLLRDYLEVSVKLPIYWSDVFLIVSIYLGSRSRTYWSSGLKGRAAFRLALGLGCALFICILIGAFPTTHAGRLSNSLLWVVTGFFFFELFDGAASATFSRKVELQWHQDFFRYFAYSAPSVALGIPVIVFGWWLEYLYQTETRVDYGLISLQIYIVVLASYWIVRGILSSADEQKGGTRMERFLSSSNTRVGLFMMRAILGAAIFITLEAGINLVQS